MSIYYYYYYYYYYYNGNVPLGDLQMSNFKPQAGPS